MDELTKIRAFVDVVENGSFSAAARRSNVPVSTVARQIKLLEDDLGTRLLNRTTRSQAITEAGRFFYDRMRDLVRAIDTTKHEVRALHDDLRGTIKIALRVSSSELIIPALTGFLARYPHIDLRVVLTDERLDLVAEGIDVAVWLGHLQDSGTIARRLTSSHRVVCGSPGYFARAGRPTTPLDLLGHNCLVFDGHGYSNVWRFSDGASQIEVPVSGNLRSAAGTALLSAVEAGIGIALLQEFMIRRALADGLLEAVLPGFAVSPTDDDTALYAVYPHSRGLSRKARVFVDFLVELFRRHDG